MPNSKSLTETRPSNLQTFWTSIQTMMAAVQAEHRQLLAQHLSPSKFEVCVEVLEEALVKLLRDFERKLRVQGAVAFQQYNAQLPINRLPAEVLTSIFESCTTDHSYDIKHYKNLACLASVCSLWRSVIQGSPTLWTVLHSSFKEDLVKTILQRSGSLPLTVQWETRSWHPLTGPQPFADSVRLHVHRWACLHMEHPVVTSHKGKTSFNLTAPQLQYLSIHYDAVQYEWDAPISDTRRWPLITNAPMLRGLSLFEASLEPYAASFSTLRQLMLDDLQHCSVPSLITLLSSNPSLTHIAIRRVEFQAMHSTPESAFSFALSHLQTLSMTEVSSNAASRILACLEAPSVRCVDLDLQIEDWSSSAQNDPFKSMRRLLCATLFPGGLPSSIPLGLHPIADQWHLRDVTAAYKVEDKVRYRQSFGWLSNGPSLGNFMAFLSQLYGASLKVPSCHVGITLNLPIGRINTPCQRSLWQNISAHLAYARSIDISCEKYTSQTPFSLPSWICQSLMDLKLGKKSEPYWTFPRLRELSVPIPRQEDLNAVIAMLEARSSSDLCNPPDLLEKLTLWAKPGKGTQQTAKRVRSVFRGELKITGDRGHRLDIGCWGSTMEDVQHWPGIHR